MGIKIGLGGVVVVSMCCLGCTQSELQAVPGVPLKVERGYCFLRTEFSQGGKQLNRSDTLETLELHEEPKPYAEAGETFDVASYVTGIIGGGLVGGGLVAQSDADIPKTTSTALIASGAVALVGSIVMCAVAENKYATAVDLYNEKVVPSERRPSVAPAPAGAPAATANSSSIADTSLP